MEPSVKKPRVEGRHIGTKRPNSLTVDGKFIPEELRDSIDPTMIEMMKSLTEQEGREGFSESLAEYAQNLAVTLKKARAMLSTPREEGAKNLESLACELSHHALRLGAVNLLRAAFELQQMARCGDYNDAARMMDDMELEYLKVQQSLSSVV